MTGPTEAAYEAARAAYDSVVITHGAFGHRTGHHEAVLAAVDAVWSLARTQVAAEIRASVRVPGEAVGPARLMFAEWAARIAEGDQP